MDSRARQLAHYLVTNSAKPLRLLDVSRALNVSESHLARIFRRETGMSPQQYVKVVRLDNSRKLLETTFLLVKEVMARVGFNDPSHFVRDFERAFGESPRRYREHHAQRRSSLTDDGQ